MAEVDNNFNNFTVKVVNIINNDMGKHIIYEIHLLDRKEQGLNPWKYSGSDYNDNPDYLGSSTHSEYHKHLKESTDVQKIVRFSYDNISKIELRKRESKLQKRENHAGSKEYYNLSNAYWGDPSIPETRTKISASIKALGVCPYSEKTISKEAIEKREAKKTANKGQWWHDPKTEEYRFIKTAHEKIPSGWERGRVPKREVEPKTRGVDYTCNAKKWVLYENDKVVFEGHNLKEYLRSKGLESIYPSLTKCCKQNKTYRSYKYNIALSLKQV